MVGAVGLLLDKGGVEQVQVRGDTGGQIFAGRAQVVEMLGDGSRHGEYGGQLQKILRQCACKADPLEEPGGFLVRDHRTFLTYGDEEKLACFHFVGGAEDADSTAAAVNAIEHTAVGHSIGIALITGRALGFSDENGIQIL